MIRLVRTTGLLLIAAGAVLLLTWLIEPLRMFWPWFRAFPLPVQLGTGAAALGLIIVLASLIHERLEDRAEDRDLLDEFVVRTPTADTRAERGETDS
jgi:hypothetical protein